VLKRVQTVVSEFGDILARRPHTEDATGILGRPVLRVEVIRQIAIGLSHTISLGPYQDSYGL
jgi:hypothetical protein